MKQKSGPDKAPAEQVLKDIRRQTRRQYSAEEKIRIVLEGLRGEENISELCRREGIAASMYYGWSKEFLEAGKRRLAGDTARAATSNEVKDLRREARALKEVVVKFAQGPSPSCADGRWRLYCSHVRSRNLSRSGVLAMHLLIFFISNLLGATGAAIISGAKRSRRHADRSQGCFRVRAAIPATICIATPNNHQQPTRADLRQTQRHTPKPMLRRWQGMFRQRQTLRQVQFLARLGRLECRLGMHAKELEEYRSL